MKRLYDEFVSERVKAVGSVKSVKEAKVRKKEFRKNHTRVNELILQAKNEGVKKEDVEKYVLERLDDPKQVVGIDPITIFLIRVIVEWLIKRLLWKFYDNNG